MDLKTIDKKLSSYRQLDKIANLNRSISLIEINNLQKRLAFLVKNQHYKLGLLKLLSNDNKLIKTFVTDKDDLIKWVKRIARPSKRIVIYLTNVEKYTRSFYEKTNQQILDKHNKFTQYIALGKESVDFLEKQKFNIVYSNPANVDQINVAHLSEYIYSSITNDDIELVQVVLNTNKVKNFTATIFPFDEFNYASLSSNTNLDNLPHEINHQYPNKIILSNVLIRYQIALMLKTLFLESSFINYKYKLIEENKQLKEIQKQILNFKIHRNKVIRQFEIEEISILRQNSKINWRTRG